jgi:hypothetical protein
MRAKAKNETPACLTAAGMFVVIDSRLPTLLSHYFIFMVGEVLIHHFMFMVRVGKSR